MAVFRLILSVMAFCVSVYLAYDLVVNGFNIYVLLCCIGGFILAKYLWPGGYKEDSAWFELLELVIYLPYQTIAFSLRSIGRIVKSGDGGIGID